jgi:hypothetical protein|tara:strand:+ start:584 stop:769 length:186 start_codon:yes stop_codon:yes gene_type:complete
MSLGKRRATVFRAYRTAINSIKSKGGEATVATKRYDKLRRWKYEHRRENNGTSDKYTPSKR